MAIRQRIIRTPEYEGLPEFTVGNVTVANARVDKFEMVFPRHQIEYQNIERFREYLGELSEPGSLFGVYNPGIGITRPINAEALQFRAGRVFTGKLISFRGIYNQPDRRRFTIKLIFNFSRFAANNTATAMQHLPAVSWLGAETDGYPRIDTYIPPDTITLEKNDAILNALEQQSLDRSNNWMLGNVWQASNNIEQKVASYIAACIDYIENQFFLPLFPQDYPTRIYHGQEPFGHWGINPDLLPLTGILPIFDWSGFIINRAEVYHEFRHENAVDFMRYIAPRIREIAPIIREREHSYTIEGRTYDSPTITVELSRGIYLCVYAKTMHRTRWEIRFRNSIRDTLNDISTTSSSYYGTLYEMPGIGAQERDIGDLMSIAIRYATEALQRFVSQLRLDTPANTSTSVIAIFIQHITVACENNTAIITQVLSPLLRDGHITESNMTRDAISALHARGVLDRAQVNRRDVAHTAGYRITTAYAGVLEALMNA